MIEWSRNSGYDFMSVVETFFGKPAGILILAPLMMCWKRCQVFKRTWAFEESSTWNSPTLRRKRLGEDSSGPEKHVHGRDMCQC